MAILVFLKVLWGTLTFLYIGGWFLVSAYFYQWFGRFFFWPWLGVGVGLYYLAMKLMDIIFSLLVWENPFKKNKE